MAKGLFGSASSSPGGGQSSGPSTDASNPPVIDPTKNVLDLVNAANQRQDDLREVFERHQYELRRADKEVMKVRAELGEKLRVAESNRIDAIRAVDVGAVSRAAEVSATQATTLAAQVATSAETLRGQVQAAATASTIALAAALEPIQKSIDDLRRVQYEQQGQRTAVSEGKEDSQTGRGNTQWIIALVITVLFSFLSLVIGTAALLFTLTR